MSGLMSRAEVLELVGLTYPAVWALMDRGEFPRSVRISKTTNSVRWHRAEVEAWVASLPRTRLKSDKLAEAAAAE